MGQDVAKEIELLTSSETIKALWAAGVFRIEADSKAVYLFYKNRIIAAYSKPSDVWNNLTAIYRMAELA